MTILLLANLLKLGCICLQVLAFIFPFFPRMHADSYEYVLDNHFLLDFLSHKKYTSCACLFFKYRWINSIA